MNGVAFVFMTRCCRVLSAWFWIDIITVYAEVQSETETDLQNDTNCKIF
jgi:hypothetical protein